MFYKGDNAVFTSMIENAHRKIARMMFAQEQVKGVAKVRPETERRKELLDEAQNTLLLLDSLQKYLYCKRVDGDAPMPEFNPQTYFEDRGMIADEKTMGLLREILMLYNNAVTRAEEFNLLQRFLTAPSLKMDSTLANACGRIARLGKQFARNRDGLRKYMECNGMDTGLHPMPRKILKITFGENI